MPLRVNDDGSLPMWRDSDGRPKLAADVETTLLSDAAPHTHAEYAASDHAHVDGGVADHIAAADPHVAYALDADLANHETAGHVHEHDYSATGHTHSYAATDHTHPGGSEAFPVGAVFLSVVATNPATLLGYGTWAAFGAGRVLIGNDGATYGTDEATGGAATSAVSAHSGAAVADHAALTHSGSAVADHATHTHTYTQVVNHVHVQTVNSATTGGLSGYTPDTSSNSPATSGYSTANPTGGVATGTTNTESATQTHTVTQPAQHAAQSHQVTQPGDHTDVSTIQPYIVVHMWKRVS